MNAGGKKAVLWGTAVDNLRVVAHGRPAGQLAGSHAGSTTIWARFTMCRWRASSCCGRTGAPSRIRPRYCAGARLDIEGATFRKIGLGKDVTDKFLGGLPGVQKEGCDGLITAARWVLHRMPSALRTVCLEFFGQARDAIPGILEITRYLESTAKSRGAVLAGLEHLDERYLRAVGYSTKSKRGALPKMVLLGDIVGEDDAMVAAATSQVVRIANARSGEGFIAVSAEARRKFWLDRARTAAIAKHTNAFKSTRMWSSRSNASANTPTPSSASTSNCRSATSSSCSMPWMSISPARSRRARPRTSMWTAGRRPASCWRASGSAGGTCSAPWMRRTERRARSSAGCRTGAFG